MTDVNNCDNCGVGHGPDDIFCENCGYDFITGSLPGAAEGFPAQGSGPAPAGGEAGSAAPGGLDPSAGAASSIPSPANAIPTALGTKLHLLVEADEAYFAEVVSEGELDYPDPPPGPTSLELAGDEFFIGRTSQSRAIHPDLDIAELTGDVAVSSRHAVLRLTDEGRLTLTDVGSTNGTFVGTVDSKAIAVGEVTDIGWGVPFYVGAWTKITVSEESPAT